MRFFSLSVKTRFDSAAAGSHVATTRRRFTAHAQSSHVVTMCTLTLNFLCISSSDNQGSDYRGWTVGSLAMEENQSLCAYSILSGEGGDDLLFVLYILHVTHPLCMQPWYSHT